MMLRPLYVDNTSLKINRQFFPLGSKEDENGRKQKPHPISKMVGLLLMTETITGSNELS